MSAEVGDCPEVPFSRQYLNRPLYEAVQVDGVFTLRVTDDDTGAVVVIRLTKDGSDNLRDELCAERDTAVRDLLWTLEEEQQNRDFGKTA